MSFGGCWFYVYTLGDNDWKAEQHIDYSFTSDIGVLVNGYLHWLGRRLCENCDDQVIVSFNISDEKFGEIQLPRESLESNHELRSVGLLEGCLCMVAHAESVGIDIWVMPKYGVQEPWEKRYVISRECFLNYKEAKDYPIFLKNYKFLRSLENGEILLAVLDTLVIYDPERGSLRGSDMLFPSTYYEHDYYFDSLVRIGSGSHYYTGEAEEEDGSGSSTGEEEEEDEEEAGEEEEEDCSEQ